MNIIVSENDKKVMSILIAGLVLVLFIFGIFKPMMKQNKLLEEQAEVVKEQVAQFDAEAALVDDMLMQESTIADELEMTLARFYPAIQSQDAENMATTLLMNHRLKIQSLTVTMPEEESRLDWYQYSANGALSAEKKEEDKEKKEKALHIYAIRVNCVAEGEAKNIWALLDDISKNYPAISILDAEWELEQSNRLILTLEIFTSNS